MNHDRFDTHPISTNAANYGHVFLQCAHEEGPYTHVGERCKSLITISIEEIMYEEVQNPEYKVYCRKHLDRSKYE